MDAHNIKLRPATFDDATNLLEWRNDPLTRKASHNTAEVLIEDHIAWLSSVLKKPNRHLFVAEENGVPIGMIRADLENGVHELSWTVAPYARGRGLAKRMAALLANQITGPIRAEVKDGNAQSVKIAEFVGMKLERSENGVLHFMRVAITPSSDLPQ